MAEYIEREAVLLHLNDIWLSAMPTDTMYDDDRQLAMVRCMGLNDAMDVVKEAPAADVRPAVMCRDCVNYIESGEANGEKMCVIDADWCAEDGCYYGFTAHTLPDWFCAGGKKREES
jgi:hypothetical protein